MKNDYSELEELKTDNFDETISSIKDMVNEAFGTTECKFVNAKVVMITNEGDFASFDMSAKGYDKEAWEKDEEE